ncbi:YqaE/Pmp3 family membrane protein [Enterobacter hormaechei]|uniref:YqaE/Pmp3 family membrane protein n=1 Tax=Enterobacter hormaechei TaxID=158836 RepID=A0A4Y5ZQ12_9ENTR|nr:YqaE/Pmp3 family membrane protein [Enterobacter hormaechei]
MGFGALFYDYSPPLGVLLGKGLGWAFILNILLTITGYFPGLIHAFWVQTKS